MWQRWNQTTHIFEKSTDDGGSWVPLPLDAVILTEGSLVSARLPNPITVDLNISKVRSVLSLLHSGTSKFRIAQILANVGVVTSNASYDGTNWNLDDTGLDGNIIFFDPSSGWTFYHLTAGANPRTPVLKFKIDTAGAFYERGRSVAAGAWTTFTPSNFITNGTGAVSAVVNVYSGYTLVAGKTMKLSAAFTFTLAGGGGGDTIIAFDIPGGFTAANAVQNGIARLIDPAAGTDTVGISFVISATNNKIHFAKIAPVAFGNAAGHNAQLAVDFEIA